MSSDLHSFDISSFTLYIICSTDLMLTSLLVVEGFSLLKLSFITTWPSLNLMYHSKTHVHDMVFSPYTCWSISSACFPNRVKKFRSIRFSVHRAEQPKKRKRKDVEKNGGKILFLEKAKMTVKNLAPDWTRYKYKLAGRCLSFGFHFIVHRSLTAIYNVCVKYK